MIATDEARNGWPNASTTSAVVDCLHHLEREHDVTILFAAESGSRAWGFPSPDSDYDVRFVYAHRRDWYLSIEPARRDVIEQAIEADLDVSGWDLRKALGLALKPNPVLHEWLMSPIVYRQHDAMAAKLREFTSVVLAATPPVGHYNGLCASQSNRHVRDRPEVGVKKYFYVLRPALALRWMRLRGGEPMPMSLSALMAGTELSPAEQAAIGDLVERKRHLAEAATVPHLHVLDMLIEAEMAWSDARLSEEKSGSAKGFAAADDLFRSLLDDCERLHRATAKS